jgi:hypothetical protein
MALKSLRKQGGGTEETFRAQSNADSAFGDIGRSLILDGVLLENIAIGTANTQVEHKLGRAYRGYIICKNGTFCDIRSNSDANNKLFLNLQATVSCTVSLWVF